MIPAGCLLCLISLVSVVNGNKIHVGALVHWDSLEAKIINYVVEYVNSRDDMLPNHFVAVRYPRSDDIHANMVYEALHMVEEGLSVLVSPSGADDILVLHRLLGPKAVSVIAPTETSDLISRKRFLVQLNTPDIIMNRAICNTLSYFNWTRVAVLTCEGEWSQAIQNIWNACMSNGVTISSLHEHKLSSLPEFVDAGPQLRSIKDANTRIILLYTRISFVPIILRDAYDMGLLEAGYAWIVVDVHAQMSVIYEHAIPKGFPPYLKGLLVLRPLMSDGNLLRQFTNEWRNRGIETAPMASLYSDAILLFCYALHEMILDRSGAHNETSANINILGQARWTTGDDLFDYMMKQRFNGVSREIRFDKSMTVADKRFGLFNVADGRSNIDYFDYDQIGMSKIGHWEEETGLKIYPHSNVMWLRNLNYTPSDLPKTLEGMKFKVVTIESPPFVIVDQGVEGNARYRGFLPDLLRTLQQRLLFEYELYEVEDNSWGAMDPVTGIWGGVIGDVVRGKAHFTLADLAVTSVRDEIVRYSQSYFRSGMSLSMAVEDSQKTMFYWLSPLAPNVWGSVILFGLICAVSMSSYSKLSPFGLYGRYNYMNGDQIPDSESKNRFSFKNCIWFIVSSFFQQGPDNGSPTCISGRIVAMSWWLICLLIIIMYSANLTANLTVSNMKKPIDSLESLLSQNEYTFGSIKGTSYENIFNGSKLKLYKMIASQMLWLDSSAEAYNKSTYEKFVFIWDTPQIDFNQPKYDCKFTRVGAEFGYSQYALAFPKYNESMGHVVDLIDKEILALMEVSALKKSFDDWLASSTSACNADIAKNTEALDTHDLKGVFVVMLALLSLSFTAFVCEVIFAAYLDKRSAGIGGMTMVEAVRARWLHTISAINQPLEHRGPLVNLDKDTSESQPDRFLSKFKNLKKKTNDYFREVD